jgi:hypothetical protein
MHNDQDVSVLDCTQIPLQIPPFVAAESAKSDYLMHLDGVKSNAKYTNKETGLQRRVHQQWPRDRATPYSRPNPMALARIVMLVVRC